MYQAQLNRVDFRSFAPAAGVKYCGPRPRPRPPPPCAAAGGGALAPPCAKTEGASPIVKAIAIATPVHIVFFKAMAISRSRLVVGVAVGDAQDLAVRPRHRLEEPARLPVTR